MMIRIFSMLPHAIRAFSLLVLLSGAVCAKDPDPEFPSTEGWYFQIQASLTLEECEKNLKYNQPFTTPASQNIQVEYFHNKEGRIARFSTRDGVVVMELLNLVPLTKNTNYWQKGVNRVCFISSAHSYTLEMYAMIGFPLIESWKDKPYMETSVTSDTIRMKEDFDKSVVRLSTAQFVSGRIEKFRSLSFSKGTTYGMEKKGVWPDTFLSDRELNALALDNPFPQIATFTYANASSQWPGQWEYVIPMSVKTVSRMISAKPITPELTYAKVKEEWTRGLKPVLRGGFDKKETPKRPVVQYIGGGVLLFLFLLGGVWYYRKGREE